MKLITSKLFIFFLIFLNFSFISEKKCDKEISEERFEILYKNLKNNKYDEKKYIIISAYTSRECISINQFLKFIDLISDHQKKLLLTKNCYHSLFDKTQTYLLNSLFSEDEIKIITNLVNSDNF